MLTQRHVLAALATTGIALAATVQAVEANPVPVATKAFHYIFDEGSGDTYQNFGTIGGSGSFVEINEISPSFSSFGEGVFGDYAYDNSDLPGTRTDGGYGVQTFDSSGLPSTVQSATMSAWIRPTVDFTSNDPVNQRGGRLFTLTDVANPTGDDIALRVHFNHEGVVARVGASGNVESGTTGDLDISQWVDEWIHLTVVFDGASSDVRFYVGSESNASQLVATVAANVSDLSLVGGPDGELRLGADQVNDTTDRGFPGMIDDFRLYMAGDGSAALGLSDIQLIQTGGEIPEPASLALLGLGGLLMLRRRR